MHSGAIGERGASTRETPLAGTPTHDLTVTAANVTTLAGMPVNFTATIAGAAPVRTTWWWGDGTTSSATSNPATHTYANPGIYLVYGQATDSSGNVHDNLGALLRFAVLDSYTNDARGNETQIQGSVVANATTTTSAEAVLSPGQWVQVSNWVTNLPTNPQWTLGTPSYTLASSAAPYANISTILGTGLNLSAETLSLNGSIPQGSYTLNFSVPDVNPYGASSGTTWNNYTFTIFVSPSAATPATPLPVSPHNGILEMYQVNLAGVYEGLAGTPSMTLDPALADDATDGAILQNIYQTLIVYNGSAAGPEPSDFVPDLATCVPGSTQCQSLYGSSLVSGDNWTFVINPNATFYNGTTGATSSVYPNDVAFSFARSCLFADGTGVEAFEDFVLCQSLLPSNANSSWDNMLHAPYNNTPANILNAMTVNDTRFCPTGPKGGFVGNGCITLDTSASGRAWPEFLEFVESSSGWAVISCSWAASVGLGLPLWTNGSKCYPAPPGSAGNPNPIPSDSAWDSYELAFGSFGNISPPYGIPNSPLRYHAMGSGPYYLTSFSDVTGYNLSANPDWGGTTCQGGRLEGCLPPANRGGHAPTYIPTVVSHFEIKSSNGPGLAALASGTADLVDVTVDDGFDNYLGNGSTVFSEAQAGLLDYMVGPSLTTQFDSMDLLFNVTAASSFLGATVTLPANALQDLNFRQFLIHSYPYLTSENQDCLIDGILYCFNTGGAIPVGMGGYYPTNISWPLTDPDTNPNDVGSAAWWWNHTSSDSIVGDNCTTAMPCTFPIPWAGPMPNYPVLESWNQTIRTISHGAIQPTIVMTTGSTLSAGVSEPPAIAPFAIKPLSWGADYFDPSDFANPYYVPDSFFNPVTGFAEYISQYNRACAGPVSDPTVTTSCQGTAYAELVSLVQSADSCAPPSCSQAQRELLYNMAERIADNLGIYLNIDQQAAVFAFAPWIAASSLLQSPDRNNVFGGAASEQPFFFLQYAASIPQGYQLQVQLTSPGVTSSVSTTATVIAPAVDSAGSPGVTLEAGEPFLTLVSVSGGTGIYHYIWNDLPTGCLTVSTAVLTCRPTGGGNFSMSVTVVDSKGDTGSSNAIALAVAPHVAISGFEATPSNVVLGKSVAFTLSATGGIGPLTYGYAGLPPGCVSSNVSTFSCTPTAVGHYSITASATDSIGFQAFAPLDLNVSTATTPSNATFLGLSGNEGYYLLAEVLVVAVVLGVAWGWRRRRDRSRKSEEEGRVAPAASPGAAAGTLVCPRCGALDRAGAKYCDECGSPLSP